MFGPEFFLLYVNDLVHVSKLFKSVLFADKTIVFVVVHTMV